MEYLLIKGMSSELQEQHEQYALQSHFNLLDSVATNIYNSFHQEEFASITHRELMGKTSDLNIWTNVNRPQLEDYEYVGQKLVTMSNGELNYEIHHGSWWDRTFGKWLNSGNYLSDWSPFSITIRRNS